jgi:hypothetical protein
MRRHIRNWSTHDAYKLQMPPTPTLRLRPVRPAPPARDAIPGNRPDRPFRPRAARLHAIDVPGFACATPPTPPCDSGLSGQLHQPGMQSREHRPDRPLRPVGPALSLATPTRRSVACDRRTRVRMRINAGTYPAATNTHPRQSQIQQRPAERREFVSGRSSTPRGRRARACGAVMPGGRTFPKNVVAARPRLIDSDQQPA